MATSKVISAAKYMSIASNYSDIRTKLDGAVDYLYDAVYTIVTLNDTEPTLDLLQSFFDVYTTQRQTILSNAPFVTAVRALNNHILNRAIANDGKPYTSLDGWLDEHAVEVPSNWVDMSAAAGLVIDEVYCSNC